jgi:hypothetical protein
MVDWTGLAFIFTCPKEADLPLLPLARTLFTSVHFELSMVRNILKSDLSISNACIAGIL